MKKVNRMRLRYLAARLARESGLSFEALVETFGVQIATAADVAIERDHDWHYRQRSALGGPNAQERRTERRRAERAQ